MTLGKRIRDMRRDLGLSQEEVARRAGLSLKGMGDIERGTIEDPHYSTLSGIAEALGVRVSELVGEEYPLPDEESSYLYRPVDVKNLNADELVRLRLELEEERKRLRPGASGYRSKKEFNSPEAERVRDAYVAVLENFFEVRDALDRINAEQHVAGAPD